jgi:hypothetical protein
LTGTVRQDQPVLTRIIRPIEKTPNVGFLERDGIRHIVTMSGSSSSMPARKSERSGRAAVQHVGFVRNFRADAGPVAQDAALWLACRGGGLPP